MTTEVTNPYDRSRLRRHLARCSEPHDHAAFRPDPNLPLWCQNVERATPDLHGFAGHMCWLEPRGLLHDTVVLCYCGQQFRAEGEDLVTVEDDVFAQLAEHAARGRGQGRSPRKR